MGMIRRDAPALVIAGMHRSGTSIVALALAALGVDLADDIDAPSAENPAGYGEDRAIVDLHRKLFAQVWPDSGVAGPGHHHDWGYDPAERFDPSAFSTVEAEADDLLGRPCESAVWGWKDPRTTLVLDEWVRRLADPRVLLVVRHPDAVASSMALLTNPDWRDPVLAHRIWRFYNRRVLRFARRTDVPCAVVDGSLGTESPETVAGVLDRHLGIALDPVGVSFGHLHPDRFDPPGVRHSLPPAERAASDLLWRRLRRRSVWPGGR